MSGSSSNQYTIADSKSFPRECGIYCILNTINGKRYIGKTRNSKGFAKRWREHISDLLNNRHKNIPLQNAWNFYKPEAFIFYILEVTDKDQPAGLWKLEADYINKLQSLINQHGYNLEIPTDEGGKIVLEETRIKAAAAKLGHAVDRETRDKIRNTKLAQRLKMSAANKAALLAANSKRVRSAEERAKISRANTGKKRTAAQRLAMSKAHSPEPFKLVHLATGRIVIGNNLTQFAKENGLIQSLLSKVLHGKRNHHKGWHLYRAVIPANN